MRSNEKPSKCGQWLENDDTPIATRSMNKQEIEEHRKNLVQSYKCSDNEIYYKFQKIVNEEDEDRDDCLWLKYYLKCVVDSIPTDREIFRIKLPIPEDLRKLADQMKKQVKPTWNANLNTQPLQNPSHIKPVNMPQYKPPPTKQNRK